jgi:hypothetical protein
MYSTYNVASPERTLCDMYIREYSKILSMGACLLIPSIKPTLFHVLLYQWDEFMVPIAVTWTQYQLLIYIKYSDTLWDKNAYSHSWYKIAVHLPYKHIETCM